MKVDELAGKSKEAWQLFGRVDILVNCGGMSVRGGVVDTQLHVYR